MSNPESFIDEVTDEVRRDKLFAFFKRWGWIGIAAVLLIVGGASVNEYRKARHQAESEAFGDAVLSAMDIDDPAVRRAALAEVPATGSRAGLLGLLLSADPVSDRPAALAALEAVAADQSLSPSYRDLAVLRRVLVAGADMPAAERRALLDPIAAPGRPYRAMALEQLALIQIEQGETDGALTALQALQQDQEASATLRSRVAQVIVALGGPSATE